jgi:hypothetical protein
MKKLSPHFYKEMLDCFHLGTFKKCNGNWMFVGNSGVPPLFWREITLHYPSTGSTWKACTEIAELENFCEHLEAIEKSPLMLVLK